jgi:hypothetical protein
MKIGRWLTVIVGAALGAAAIVWWVRYRQIPTVRVSYTLGKGREVELDWIQLPK